MDDVDAHLVIPSECVDWCRSQPYAVTVLEDVVHVDLDWWNERLVASGIPAQVSGRDADGEQIWRGRGYLRRGDLEPGVHGLTLTDEPEFDRLYMCAAWLAEHPLRGGVRRFVDIAEPGDERHRFDAIGRALVACRSAQALFHAAAYREWSGWPTAPGVGHALMSLYCWAVHAGDGERPQLLDNSSAGSLTWNGWLVASSVSLYSVGTYVRYNALVQRWARQAGVAPELVEMWLNRQWQLRLAQSARHRDGSEL